MSQWDFRGSNQEVPTNSVCLLFAPQVACESDNFVAEKFGCFDEKRGLLLSKTFREKMSKQCLRWGCQSTISFLNISVHAHWRKEEKEFEKQLPVLPTGGYVLLSFLHFECISSHLIWELHARCPNPFVCSKLVVISSVIRQVQICSASCEKTIFPTTEHYFSDSKLSISANDNVHNASCTFSNTQSSYTIALQEVQRTCHSSQFATLSWVFQQQNPQKISQFTSWRAILILQAFHQKGKIQKTVTHLALALFTSLLRSFVFGDTISHNARTPCVLPICH